MLSDSVSSKEYIDTALVTPLTSTYFSFRKSQRWSTPNSDIGEAWGEEMSDAVDTSDRTSAEAYLHF